MERTILASRTIDTPFSGNNLGRRRVDEYQTRVQQHLDGPDFPMLRKARYPRTSDATNEMKKEEEEKEEVGEETLADTSFRFPRRFKGRDTSFRRGGVQLPNECIPFSFPPKREGIFRTAQFSVPRRVELLRVSIFSRRVSKRSK